MSQTNFSSRDLRNALSSFATGVTIVTSREDDGSPVGMTASSFNSVSMEPPLVLWSVTKTAHSAEIFKSAKHFNVHVLASDQTDLSNAFAKSGADKFSGVEYKTNDHGIPILPYAAARFECSTWAVYEGGDHWIIVGEVQAIERQPTEPLVFSGGAYATAASLRPASPDPEEAAKDQSHVDGLLIYNLSRAYRQLADTFHATVRESGLSIREWRVLASLHGETPRTLNELTTRTFINPRGLMELLANMREAGLCIIEGSGDDTRYSGTEKGNEQVERLFALSGKQEQAAVGDDEKRDQLLDLLQLVVRNTHD
ncbi:flavin reductase [Pseudahrensia aquimaris]|uniref:Flavin reductase n=1 Tax=Pseudahrensia aquimaris TaxID=744461 RepID=A0ABW3FD90_9HYPH